MGKVIMFDDLSAIVGATVEIVADTDLDGVPDTGTPLYSTVTDSLGRFRFTGVADGDYLIKLTIPGGLYVQSGIDESSDGDNPADLSTIDEYIPLTMTSTKIDLDNIYRLTDIPP
jgi:hypothetical protein